MSFNLTPPVKVLKAVKATLDAIDWVALGLPLVTTRFARSRYAVEAEQPCISLRWVSDEVRTADMENNYLTSGEMLVEMMIVMEIELEVPEDGLEETDPMFDPTGLGLYTSISFAALRALKAEGAEILNWADDVVDRGRAMDDEFSTPDDGRFEQTLFVLYRVRTGDPSVLLAMGEN